MLISLGTFVGLIIFAIITVPSTLTASDNSSAVVKGNELTACRNEASASLVTDARTDLDGKNSAVVDLVAQFVEVIQSRDQGRAAQIFHDLPIARQARADAQDRLDSQTKEYQALVKQSRTDPMAFLGHCHRGF